mmetsp:Transcript_10645/g.23952  ORF Transcript_10645/g.23952 Transcript_10645/m.23952 type:complete len:717 (+) Transcript_10645:48-2198(+)
MEPPWQRTVPVDLRPRAPPTAHAAPVHSTGSRLGAGEARWDLAAGEADIAIAASPGGQPFSGYMGAEDSLTPLSLMPSGDAPRTPRRQSQFQQKQQLQRQSPWQQQTQQQQQPQHWQTAMHQHTSSPPQRAGAAEDHLDLSSAARGSPAGSPSLADAWSPEHMAAEPGAASSTRKAAFSSPSAWTTGVGTYSASQRESTRPGPHDCTGAVCSPGNMDPCSQSGWTSLPQLAGSRSAPPASSMRRNASMDLSGASLGSPSAGHPSQMQSAGGGTRLLFDSDSGQRLTRACSVDPARGRRYQKAMPSATRCEAAAGYGSCSSLAGVAQERRDMAPRAKSVPPSRRDSALALLRQPSSVLGLMGQRLIPPQCSVEWYMPPLPPVPSELVARLDALEKMGADPQPRSRELEPARDTHRDEIRAVHAEWQGRVAALEMMEEAKRAELRREVQRHGSTRELERVAREQAESTSQQLNFDLQKLRSALDSERFSREEAQRGLRSAEASARRETLQLQATQTELQQALAECARLRALTKLQPDDSLEKLRKLSAERDGLAADVLHLRKANSEYQESERSLRSALDEGRIALEQALSELRSMRAERDQLVRLEERREPQARAALSSDAGNMLLELREKHAAMEAQLQVATKELRAAAVGDRPTAYHTNLKPSAMEGDGETTAAHGIQPPLRHSTQVDGILSAKESLSTSVNLMDSEVSDHSNEQF